MCESLFSVLGPFLCLLGLGRCCGFLIYCGRLLLRSGGLQSRLIHRGGCQLCSGGSRLHLLHRNRLLLCSGGLQSHLIHRGGCQLCSGGPRLCLIHRGGCQLCTGVLQFHSGSMLHWLCLGPLSPHERGLPTLHGPGLPSRPVPPSLHYSLYCFMWTSGSRFLGRGYVMVGLLAHHQRLPNTYTPHGLYLELHFPSCYWKLCFTVR